MKKIMNHNKLEYHRNYYQKNKEKILTRNKKHYHENKEEKNKYSREYRKNILKRFNFAPLSLFDRNRDELYRERN